MNKIEIKKVTNLLKPFLKVKISAKGDRFQRVILTYHGISNHSSFNCVAKDMFRDQIAWLKENYIVVPLSELIKNIGSRNTKKAHIASLTFDDGYVNFCEHAVPILEEYGCHATVFIPSGKVGCHNDWDEGEKGFQKMPIMSYQQLREFPEEIVEIGSHGISHIALGKLASHEVQREILESRSEIEQKIGRRVRFFSFPFGSYPFQSRSESNQNIKRLLSAYAGACTVWWGRFNEQKDTYAMRRIGIWESDSFEDFLDKMRGYYDWLAAKEKLCKFFKYINSLIKNGNKINSIL